MKQIHACLISKKQAVQLRHPQPDRKGENMDNKPINEQICDIMAEILTLESSADEIHAEIRKRKNQINSKIKELGFDIKAFNKVLADFRILQNPSKKADFLRECREIAKIKVALHQPSLFEYAKDIKDE